MGSMGKQVRDRRRVGSTVLWQRKDAAQAQISFLCYVTMRQASDVLGYDVQ